MSTNDCFLRKHARHYIHCWGESKALLKTGPEVGHLADILNSQVALTELLNFLSEFLLFVRISGEVVNEEGECVSSGVNASTTPLPATLN